MRREPLPKPGALLPAYENLEATVRRIVRDELVPVLDMLEGLRGSTAKGGETRAPTTGPGAPDRAG